MATANERLSRLEERLDKLGKTIDAIADVPAPGPFALFNDAWNDRHADACRSPEVRKLARKAIKAEAKYRKAKKQEP